MNGAPVNPTLLAPAPGEVSIIDRPIPQPGTDEVLVRTACSLVSTGTELMLLSNTARLGSSWAQDSKFPRELGYSNVGEVIEVGAGVDRGWIGKRVHSHARHQALALTPAKKLAEIPPGVSDEAAAFTTLGKVAMNALRRAGLSWGESVAVVGLGVVGQLAVRLCEFAGARPIFGAEPSDLRRSLFPQVHPFSLMRQTDKRRWPEQVREQNGRLLDVVIEASGNPDVLSATTELLRPMGRLVIASSPRGASAFDFHDACNRRSLTLIGAHSSYHPLEEHPALPWSSARHGQLFLELVECRRIDVEPLITHRVSHQQATEVYARLLEDRRNALGVVLKWNA